MKPRWRGLKRSREREESPNGSARRTGRAKPHSTRRTQRDGPAPRKVPGRRRAPVQPPERRAGPLLYFLAVFAAIAWVIMSGNWTLVESPAPNCLPSTKIVGVPFTPTAVASMVATFANGR